MQFIALRAMVRKDLLLFVSDRRALIMSFIAPIAIASFFGSLFGGPGNSEPARISVAIVDEDNSRRIKGDRRRCARRPDAGTDDAGARRSAPQRA